MKLHNKPITEYELRLSYSKDTGEHYNHDGKFHGNYHSDGRYTKEYVQWLEEHLVILHNQKVKEIEKFESNKNQVKNLLDSIEIGMTDVEKQVEQILDIKETIIKK